MATLALAEIAGAVRGEMVLGAAPPDGGGGRRIAGYSIDSRSVRAGDLFFAIVGPRLDGHAFVEEAFRRGAAAAVVAKGVVAPRDGSAALVRVKDTTLALQELGAHLRRSRPLKVVGITGSAGKTTAKEMTAAVVAQKYRTHKSEGNLNNAYGLPLTLLRMNDDCEAAVLEMGMSYHGEIARLVEIADPDVGVILNVLRVHLEHFGSLDQIARAKGEMFRGLRKDAVAVYNADDPPTARLGRAFAGATIPFGLKARGAQVTAEEVTGDDLRGTSFVLRRGAERVPVRLAVPGRHHVYNALAAAAVGLALDVDGEAIARGLATVRPAPMRGVLHDLPDGLQVLDDSYNSNPAAMEEALALLRSASPRGRRILASGDMLELGPYETRAHARLGGQVADAGIDLFVAVGPRSAGAAAAARRPPRRGQGSGAAARSARGRAAGPLEVRDFPDSEEAARFLAGEARPGDLVLVKGSRGMKMERVVQALLAAHGGARTPEEGHR